MERIVVVGVNDSPGSLIAVDWAVRAALRHGCRLHLLHVLPEPGNDARAARPGPGGVPAARLAAPELLISAADRARLHTSRVDITTDALPGPVAQTLVAAGADARTLLVAVHPGLRA